MIGKKLNVIVHSSNKQKFGEFVGYTLRAPLGKLQETSNFLGSSESCSLFKSSVFKSSVKSCVWAMKVLFLLLFHPVYSFFLLLKIQALRRGRGVLISQKEKKKEDKS